MWLTETIETLQDMLADLQNLALKIGSPNDAQVENVCERIIRMIHQLEDLHEQRECAREELQQVCHL